MQSLCTLCSCVSLLVFLFPIIISITSAYFRDLPEDHGFSLSENVGALLEFAFS